jgi:hypothetical protein
LLVLLPVFAGIAGSEQLFAICSLVVLLSVIVHGGSPLILAHRRPPAQDQPRTSGGDQVTVSPALYPPVAATSTGTDRYDGSRPPSADQREAPPLRISLDEMRQLRQEGAQIILLDTRTERAYEGSDLQARGAIRFVPDRVEFRARNLGLPRDAWLIALCA